MEPFRATALDAGPAPIPTQHHRLTLLVDHSQYDRGSRARQVASSTLSLAVHVLCRILVKQEKGLGTGSANI